jgi:hypothetical protein
LPNAEVPAIRLGRRTLQGQNRREIPRFARNDSGVMGN